MDVNKVKLVIRIVKNQPLSTLIFLSIVFLPYIFRNWTSFFPESWKIPIIILITIVDIIAFLQLRNEVIRNKRAIMLYNYLKKWKWRSIKHLTTEWYGKNFLTEQTIDKLIKDCPNLFKWTDVKRKNKYYKRVGLVNNE